MYLIEESVVKKKIKELCMYVETLNNTYLTAKETRKFVTLKLIKNKIYWLLNSRNVYYVYNLLYTIQLVLHVAYIIWIQQFYLQ